jgi:hypothetical protein
MISRTANPTAASHATSTGVRGRPLTRLRTVDEAAELLNVSPRTVRRLIESGQRRLRLSPSWLAKARMRGDAQCVTAKALWPNGLGHAQDTHRASASYCRPIAKLLLTPEISKESKDAGR